MDATEKGFLRHLVAHKDRASFDAYAKWLKQVGRLGDSERIAAAADTVAAKPKKGAKGKAAKTPEDSLAVRELRQAAIALRAEEILAEEDADLDADLDPDGYEANEDRHRAQQRADNELHGANWEVDE